MKHRGEILRLRIEQSGIAKTVICKSLDIWENTLTNWCSTENLGWEKLLMTGEIIGWDFSLDFPNLKNMNYDRKAEMLYISEPVEAYKAANSEEMKKMKKVVDKLNKRFDVMQDTLQRIVKALEIK